MESIFLVLEKWDIGVLLGNVLSLAAMILNFFFMGVSIEKSLSVSEKVAKKVIFLSQTIRRLLLFVIIAFGAASPLFNTVSVIVPVFFPRLAILLRPYFLRRETDRV